MATISTSRRGEPSKRRKRKVRFIKESKNPIKFERIYNEATYYPEPTILRDALETFYEDVVHIDPDLVKKTRRICKHFMFFMFNRIKRNRHNVYFDEPIFTGSIFNELQCTSLEKAVVMLPIRIEKLKVQRTEPGYVVAPLRIHRSQLEDEQGLPNTWKRTRSEDGLYISPLAVLRVVHEIFTRFVTVPDNMGISNVELMPLEETPGRVVVVLNGAIYVNIIPAIYPNKDIEKESNSKRDTTELFFVTRPYDFDENAQSDMLWRICYFPKEKHMHQMIDVTDRGMRRKALQIMKAFLKQDNTLVILNSYHLRTVLYHIFDEVVDSSPRWQRDPLESCFQTFLQKLAFYVQSKNLPNFFQNSFNLLSNIPPRNLAALQGRLTYLMQNQADVLRLLRKRRTQSL
ncbi:unnamed protein product [Owenia fusiformis]|uniref:Mab-21-like HhH/H2TH-like domain-containing protein n=1 Tax=Owenia fusiformis TaxID=6347 RepID=A0A8S4PTS7_OWEFU|nr:unnamed protein product [Owenia fusiformis]